MSNDNGLFDPTANDEKEFRDAAKLQWLTDVARSVAELPFEGTKLAIHTAGGVFPSRSRYTARADNDGGAQNHFQGCYRLLRTPFLALLGGDWVEPSSHLFVAKLNSRGGRKTWGSNLNGGSIPPDDDRANRREDLDPLLWHAGGIDACGHLLAVPIECGGSAPGAKPPKCDPQRSRIVFFDMRSPAAPKRLATSIVRSGRKATAVGLVHIPKSGYVAAVLSAGKKDDQHQDKRIDFYQTEENRIKSKFVLKPSFVYRVPKRMKFDSYQSINLVYQTSGDLYLMGMTGKILDLFWVPFPGLGTSPPQRPSLEFLSRREFKLDKKFAEFKAGACAYAADDKLRLYAVPQWRLGDGRLHMTEWAPA